MDKPSSTEKLVTDIELLTCSTWTQAQRYEVAERIRKYRFEQVSSALAKVSLLVKESGNPELSEKIFMGKF